MEFVRYCPKIDIGMPSQAFPVTPPGIRVRTTAVRLVKLFPVLPLTKQLTPGLRVHASLEPCLATTLLRFANTSPPSGCVEDFHLQVAEYARHTKKGPIPKIGIDPELTRIRCPIVCHCQAFEKSHGNLNSLELRININYHSGYGCSSSHESATSA